MGQQPFAAAVSLLLVILWGHPPPAFKGGIVPFHPTSGHKGVIYGLSALVRNCN